jgi:membrane protease YdiL (CAAX protease family)
MPEAIDSAASVPPPGAPPRGRIRWIFVGAHGIRAGWSFLIFIAVLGAMVGAFGAFAHFVLHHHPQVPKGEMPPGQLLIREVIFLVLTLAATAIMARIERRSLWSYGLAGPRPVGNFAAGWLGGLACLSLLVGGLNAGGYLVFDGAALHGIDIIGYALIWLLVFLLVGLGEEALFRGYLQATLARGIGFWPAAIVMSLLFGLAHTSNPGEDLAGIIGVIVAGLVFCLLLRVSGSLWLGIGFHTAWDWAQSYLYGTPDSGLMMRGHLLATHAAGNVRFSGGSAGPEGSVLGGPALVLGLLALVWTARRAGLFAARQPAAAAGTVPAEA